MGSSDHQSLWIKGTEGSDSWEPWGFWGFPSLREGAHPLRAGTVVVELHWAHTAALRPPPAWNLRLPAVSTPAWEPQAAGFSGESQVLMLVTWARQSCCFVRKPQGPAILGG